MLQTYEGIIDKDGTLHLLEPINLPKQSRIIITVLDEEPITELTNLALLSEPMLMNDWERPEEDKAWSHLAQLPSL